MKTSMLCWLGFSLTMAVHAQQGEFPRSKKLTNRYLVAELGNSSQSMYDEAISYVRYKGSGMAPAFSLLKTGDNKYRLLNVSASFVTLTTDRSNGLRPMEVKTTRFTMDYRLLKKIKEWGEKTKLYIGGEIGFLFNFKRAEQLDNSQLVYDYALTIGPAAKLDKTVTFRKRDCILSAALGIPLLSHIARPYYLNRIEFIDPKNDFIGDILNNSQLVTVNKNLRINSGLALTYPLFNKNALRIGYSWDFYKTTTINSVYAAEHLISLAFLANY